MSLCDRCGQPIDAGSEHRPPSAEEIGTKTRWNNVFEGCKIYRNGKPTGFVRKRSEKTKKSETKEEEKDDD